MAVTIQRKRCPVCKALRPSYLYESHVKQCKAEKAEQEARVPDCDLCRIACQFVPSVATVNLIQVCAGHEPGAREQAAMHRHA